MIDVDNILDLRPSLHTGEVEGSIPSVPTIKTLVNQGFSDDPAKSPDTQTDGTLREHDATGRGERVEVCSADVLASIPTDPKAFQRWLDTRSLFERWPEDLIDKGHRALWSMQTKAQTPWKQSFALRKLGLADWSAFTTAYADHVGAK